MTEVALQRQRAVLPTANGALEGWMDEDAAAAAGQLFGSGPSGLLVIDSRELLASTARVVGAQLGEIHFKAWMALITLHVAHGMPEDGKGSTTLGEFASIVWGDEKNRGGGKDSRQLLRALSDLRSAQFTLPGYDFATQKPAAAVSDTSLLINLMIDETILRNYQRPRELSQYEIGKATGGKSRGTLGWRLHPDYTQHLAGSDLRRFDWSKAHRLRGSALTLWMVFSSPRVPYRPMLGSARDHDLEVVEVPLTVEHCHSLGVTSSADAGRRRTINQAGERVCETDRSFVAFEAHGGRGKDSFLRVVRRRPALPATARPYSNPDQLTLEAAAT
jgi:hypothetical protein